MNLVVQDIRIVIGSHFMEKNKVAELRHDQLEQPLNTTLLPQACTVGARHDGRIASLPSLLTLMHPLLWCKSGLIRSHDQSLCYMLVGYCWTSSPGL